MAVNNDSSTLEVFPIERPQANGITTPTTADLSRAVDVEWKAGKKEWFIISVVAFVSLMVALDATILVTALPTIAADLKGNARETYWTGTSYLLAQSVSQPFLISLSDTFGRRNFYLISLCFFLAGSILCCLAKNFTEMLSGRTVQGVGGGGLVALSLVLFTDIIPLRQLPKYYSIIQMAWGVGTTTGPVIGGVLTQHSTWRWIFYLNFPFCAIGLLLTPLVVKLHTKPATFRQRLLHVDWIGGLLFTGSTTSFLMGITWGGSEHAWDSWKTLLPILLGCAGVVGTVFFERRRTTNPFLHLTLFKSSSALAAYAGTVVQGLLMYCKLYYNPFYFEAIQDFSPTFAGLAVIPVTATLLATSAVVGRLITHRGTFRWAVWLGWAITLLSTGLLQLFDKNTKTYAWVLILLTVGLGHGFLLMSQNIAIQAMAGIEHASSAAAMYMFQRTLGMCIGVAVGGAIIENRLSAHLLEVKLPTDVASNAAGFLQMLKRMSNDSQEYQLYSQAYVKTFKNLYQVLLGVTGLAALLSLLIKQSALHTSLTSAHVFKQEDLQESAVESADPSPTDPKPKDDFPGNVNLTGTVPMTTAAEK